MFSGPIFNHPSIVNTSNELAAVQGHGYADGHERTAVMFKCVSYLRTVGGIGYGTSLRVSRDVHMHAN